MSSMHVIYMALVIIIGVTLLSSSVRGLVSDESDLNDSASALEANPNCQAMPTSTAVTLSSQALQSPCVESVPVGGTPGTRFERTFIAVKPDGVHRGLVGEIIKRFEQKGFKLVGLKMVHASKQLAEGHYHDLREKKFFAGLVEYFSSGPIVAMVWEGEDSIASGRKLLGATRPQDSAPGTIRGDYAVNVGRNICHGSDGPASAPREIAFWFKPDEIVNWDLGNAKWVYESL